MNQLQKLRGWVLGLVAVLFAGSGLPAIGLELVDNGGFETPTVTGINSYFGASAGNWAPIYGNELELHKSNSGNGLGFTDAYEGGQYLELQSRHVGKGGAKQTITTVVDKKYRVVFMYSGRGELPQRPLDNTFEFKAVDVGTSSVLRSSGTLTGKSSGTWDKYEGVFTATSTQTQLLFDITPSTDPNYSRGGFIDAVSVIEVPSDYTPKYELKILVGESVLNNEASEEGNEGTGEKPGGHQIPANSTTMITCKVPGGLSDADVKFDFAALPEESVKMYDEDDNEVTAFDTWDISEGTKTFKLVTYASFPATDLSLLAVDSTSGAQTNTADDATTSDVPVCADYVTLNGGGCGCDSSCTGEGSGTAGCLDFQIGFSGLGFDEEGGYLQLFARRPSDGLYKPESLQFFLNDRFAAEDGFTETGHTIEHTESSDSAWGKAELTLHVDGYGYDIKFYTDEGSGPTNLYRTVTVENLNGATSYDELYITEIIELDASTTPKTRMWHFEWTGTSNGETDDGSWVLTEGEVDDTVAGPSDDTILRITERAEVWNGAGDEVTETVTIKESDNTVVSKTQEVWKVFDWGREMISMTMDPDSGDALKEVWTYYDDLSGDGEDNYGRLESYQSKTGYWERYEYDADGNVAKTMRQYEDETLALGTAFATEAADNIVEEYVEDDSLSVTFGGGSKTVRVEKRQIKVQGTVERTWYEIYIDEPDSLVSGCTEEWSVRPITTDPENGTTLAAVIEDVLDGTDTTSIVTKSWHWEDGAPGIGDNEPYDVRAMQSADGQYTVYERTIATDERTTVVKRGFSDASLVNVLSGAGGADIEYGTKTTSTTDTRGNMVSTLSERISESDNSGGWFITSLMKVGVDINGDPETDEFGRPTVTEYFFGEDAADEAATPGSGAAAYDTRLTYGCCGGGEEEIRTGRDGVQTRTLEDVLGRTAYTIRWANAASPLYSVNDYDAAGRVIASGLSTDNDLDDPEDLKSSRTYDVAGRMTSATDEEGRKSYMTYRRVTTSGGTYAGTGVFYWETRGYGNDDDVPVSVRWTDSHGRTGLSYTGSGTWAGTPTGTETLTEHTRSTSVYDWDNRMVEGRAYFDIASLAKDAPGTPGSSSGGNYLITGTTEYDALGRGFRSTDASGNITETVYEDGTGRAIKTLIGVDVADLHTVQRVYYNKFVSNAPTGDDRPWPTRVYMVKPSLTTAPDDSDLDDSSPTLTDYTYTETVEEHTVDATKDSLTLRKLWTRPEHGVWTCQYYDDEGRAYMTQARANTASTVLTEHRTDYDGVGRAYQTRQKRVVNGAVLNENLTLSHTSFDDASRPVKTEATGRGYSKTEYDEYGRTKRTVFASDEGSNTDVSGGDAFTDDIVLTESVPTYDKSGRVTGTVTYERAHDATATGLLSAAAADQSRSTYSYTWYDDNGRQTHSATVGTDAAYTYVAGTPPTPNTSDDVLVGKTEYDAPGRAYLTTDNLGRQSRVFFDDLGRVTHSVENWDGLLTTPDAPTSRDADVNRITKNIYDNSATGGGARIETVAIDPDGNGNTSDNQSTLYIHSGEVNASERGPIPINGRPIALLMPDALEDGTDRADVITEINAGGEVFGDFSFTAYYANGQVERTTDQRGVQRNTFYTDEGWADYTTVTEATGNTWDAAGDLRTAYTYGDAGEVLTVTTFDNAAGTSGGATSKLTYTYDGFYNRLTEQQDHDPTSGGGAGDPKTVSWAYDATLSGNYYAKAYRLDTITYPNGRVIQLDYSGNNGIDDKISRASELEDYVDGSSDVAIVSYTYLGSGRMARKDYTTPDVRLDFIDEGSEGSDANDDYEVSWDAFGRPIRYQWETYDGSGDAGSDLVHIAHAYDRNSKKLYDERKVYSGDSKVFGHDELDRLVAFDQGLIKSDQSATEDFWVTRTQHTTLDQLGNPLEVKEYSNDSAADSFSEITALSKANEIESIKIMGERRKPALVEDEFDADTSADYELISGDGDAFSINTTNGELTVTNTGTGGETILLIGDKVGMHAAYVGLTFPDETGGEAGYVFGYTGPDDYYLAVADTQNNRRKFYRVQDGTRILIKSTYASMGTTEYLQFAALLNDTIQQTYSKHWLSEGLPAGRVGLYSSQANVKFNYLAVWSDARRPELAGRWRPTGQTTSDSDGNQIRTAEDVLRVASWVSGHESAPTVLEGVRADRFEVTYVAKGGQWDAPYLAFNSRQTNQFDAFRTYLHNSGDEFWEVAGGREFVGSTSVSANPWTNSQKWVRVTNDGTTVQAKVIVSATEPTQTDWTNASVLRETTNLDAFGGLIGFGSDRGSPKIDSVTIKTDRDANGSYETTEYEGDFTLDGDGYHEQDLVHDAAGNLTYDGRFAYTYDAFNRLITVQIAYYAPGDTTLSYGSVVNEMRYDGVNRRIVKYVKNSADLDCKYHYYYNGQSNIEERDGSGNVLRQNVWGPQYIDELVQTSLNADPDDLTEDDVETHYYVLHDTQYNIMALVDDAGGVVERYEYTPYGERQVYRAQGNQDELCLSASFLSERPEVDGIDQPYALNPFGFQGLMHDETTGLIYNRARMLNSRLKRFNQRDPLGYPDGMNTYAAYHVMRGMQDPSGRAAASVLTKYYDAMIGTHKGYIYADVTNINDLLNAMKKTTSKIVKSVVDVPKDAEYDASWLYKDKILEFNRQEDEKKPIKLGASRIVSLFHESIHIRHTEAGLWQNDNLSDTLLDESLAYAGQYLYESLGFMRLLEQRLNDGDDCKEVQTQWRRIWQRYNDVVGQEWSTYYGKKKYTRKVSPLHIYGVYNNHEKFHVNCPSYLKAIQAKYPETRADGDCCLTCDKGDGPGDLNFELHWIFKIQFNK